MVRAKLVVQGLLVFAACAVMLIATSSKCFAQAQVDAYKVTIAGRPLPATAPPLQVRRRVLLLPIRAVAQAVLADLVIDPAARTINVIRADDRQELFLDAKTGMLSIGGFQQGIQENTDLIDFTPGSELAPQNIIERMFNVFVAIKDETKEISVNPTSGPFSEALSEYEEQQAVQKKSRFQMPLIRINGAQYNTAMNINSETRQGQVSTFRTTSQFNRTVINSYSTYLGSSKGPAFRYSQGGVDVLTPSKFHFQGGDYSLRTGTAYANGINRGFVAEKYWGAGTKVAWSIGGLQSRVERVGLQMQRPLFYRRSTLFYGLFDSADFTKSPRFKTPFWKNNRLILGGGAGGWQDHRNANLHGKGILTYGLARHEYSIFGSRFRGATDMELGAANSSNQFLEDAEMKLGGAIILRNYTTLFNHVTVNTAVQRGSEHWSTFDTSNSFRNQFTYNQGITWRVINGLTLQGSYQRNRTTRGNLPPTQIWNSGGTLNLVPGILPEVSFNSSVQTLEHTAAKYFNTLFFNQPINVVRTKSNISGIWLFNNTGQNNTMNSTFSLTQKTSLYKNISTFWNKQWTNPDFTNTQVGFSSGTISQLAQVTFGLGQSGTPDNKTSNWFIGTNLFLPWINHRAGFIYSQFGKAFQLSINFSGFIGKGSQLSSASAPVTVAAPTGTLRGRFYMDNDLSGTFDPAVDKPMPGLKIIANNRILGTTDSEGRYVAPNLQRGFLSVRTDPAAIPAIYAFLTPSTQDTFILPNRTKVIDFRFARLARLEGVVKGEPSLEEAPVQDIRVFIEGSDRDTLTNEAGRFAITDVPPGKYTLKIDPDYVLPSEEIVSGSLPIDLKPGQKLTGLSFVVQKRKPKVEEKHF
jgi:hypothetical protein